MPSKIDEEKRLFKRIIQTIDDLDHARECADQILKRNLHSAADWDDKRLLRGLNTAMIVSYARPFSGNRGAEDVCKNLPKSYLDIFSAEQLKFHRLLIESRNRDHAHSDPEGRSIRVRVEESERMKFVIPVSRDAFAPLPLESVCRVVELVECMLSKLAKEYGRIETKLKDDDRF